MAERDDRDSAARHHGRRNRNTPRHVHHDDVNSRVSERASRNTEQHENHKQRNQHKERSTKMTKRTRTLSSLALAITFAFSLSANTNAAEKIDARRDLNRDRVNAEVLRPDTSVSIDSARPDRDEPSSTLRERAEVERDFDADRDTRIENKDLDRERAERITRYSAERPDNAGDRLCERRDVDRIDADRDANDRDANDRDVLSGVDKRNVRPDGVDRRPDGRKDADA